VAPARAARRRALILGAPQHVEIQHAVAQLPAHGMAERADQQGRAAASVGIGRPADVPPEPAVRPVADELVQDRAAPPGAELDPADPIGGVATVPGRADGDVLDAVAVQIAGIDDHARVLLAWLAPRPLPDLPPAGGGIDEQLPGERACLIFRRWRGHGDVALAVAV